MERIVNDFNKLEESDIQTLNHWAGYLSFQPNFIIKALGDCQAQVIGIFTGNRSGKTESAAEEYVRRILGEHPIERKNIRPDTPIRTFRFASETLPTESDEGGEVRNTVYPAIKRRLPYYLIKKDITARRPAITVRDWQGGKDIILEFVSYNQEVQSQAGVDRNSIYCDEEPPKSFYQEQIARLVTSRGDIIIGCTPTESLTWLYEDIFEEAGILYNSPHIIEYFFKKMKVRHAIKEILGGRKTDQIAVIRAATDDNPTLSKEQIDDKMMLYKEDEAEYEIRRYGIFHQISGMIFKDFDPRFNTRGQFGHVVFRNEYFPEGLPHLWFHARACDYHQHTNWAIVWVALSDKNEAFIYGEYNPNPDRFITTEIALEIAHRSRDYRFKIDMIDPLSKVKQSNTGLTPLDDLNRNMSELKREGIGTGGYWVAWDTKNKIGQDEIKKRLRNSRICGRPFNNRMSKDGRELLIPTIWFLDNCQQTIYMMKNWSKEDWSNRESALTKGEKDKEQERHSHFPKALEGIFKTPSFCTANMKDRVLPYRPSGYENRLQVRV